MPSTWITAVCRLAAGNPLQTLNMSSLISPAHTRKHQHSQVSIMGRMATKVTKVGPYTIPAGTVVGTPLFAVQVRAVHLFMIPSSAHWQQLDSRCKGQLHCSCLMFALTRFSASMPLEITEPTNPAFPRSQYLTTRTRCTTGTRPTTTAPSALWTCPWRPTSTTGVRQLAVQAY